MKSRWNEVLDYVVDEVEDDRLVAVVDEDLPHLQSSAIPGAPRPPEGERGRRTGGVDADRRLPTGGRALGPSVRIRADVENDIDPLRLRSSLRVAGARGRLGA